MNAVPETDVAVQRQYDRCEVAPSLAVLRALATIKNCQPEQLTELRLADYVDPDALDRLVREGRDIDVTFELDGYRVSIDDSDLVIRPS
jgi:hypothetical protein